MSKSPKVQSSKLKIAEISVKSVAKVPEKIINNFLCFERFSNRKFSVKPSVLRKNPVKIHFAASICSSFESSVKISCEIHSFCCQIVSSLNLCSSYICKNSEKFCQNAEVVLTFFCRLLTKNS